MLFIDKIQAVFTDHASRNAYCIQSKYYTYAQLAARVSGIQAALEANCAGEQKIGVIIKDDIETYASIIAILCSGKTYIPVHPGYPADRITQIMLQSGMKYALSKTADNAYTGITTIATGELHNGNTEISFADVSPAVNAYILFTSGSTGVPKGVPISYHNLNSFIDAFFALGYKADEHDRFLQMFDLTFDLSVMSYLVPLCIGACVYTIPDSGMKFTHIYNVLTAHDITFALMVPSAITSLRPYFSEIELPALRYSLFCGEALYSAIVTEWMQCAPNAVMENVYGPTEATIFCLTYHIGRDTAITDHNGIVAIGKPMQGMEAIVVDDQLQPLPDGEKGELCLYGNQLTTGYLDAERSKAAFFSLGNKTYYRTGDISCKNEAGDFIYCGRIDHQVKIQGFRVELSEIEFHLRDITGIANVAALAINMDNGLSQIVAIFEGPGLEEVIITNGLKTKLPPYMIPARLHFVPTFPLNVNGKTDRKALENMIKEG